MIYLSDDLRKAAHQQRQLSGIVQFPFAHLPAYARAGLSAFCAAAAAAAAAALVCGVSWFVVIGQTRNIDVRRFWSGGAGLELDISYLSRHALLLSSPFGQTRQKKRKYL